jgi:EcoRII C terminal
VIDGIPPPKEQPGPVWLRPDVPPTTDEIEAVQAEAEAAASVDLVARHDLAYLTPDLTAGAVLTRRHLAAQEAEATRPLTPDELPDFLFPSAARYAGAPHGAEDLRMLAVKSTLRDRWRQVLHEADKIPVKHLLTLDRGVSSSHIREMTDAGVRLVIPRPLLRDYPQATRPYLTTFGEFIALVHPYANGRF